MWDLIRVHSFEHWSGSWPLYLSIQSMNSYFLAHLDVGGSVGVSKMLKFLRLSFLCDGQDAVRQAILSL